MWHKWQPQMQMTLPTETVLEWYTASSMASRTSLLTLKQVKYLRSLYRIFMWQNNSLVSVKVLNIFMFYSKYMSQKYQKIIVMFYVFLVSAARQSCSEIRSLVFANTKGHMLSWKKCELFIWQVLNKGSVVRLHLNQTALISNIDCYQWA